MIPKSFDTIIKSDIDALIKNQVHEGRTIEYKQILPGNSDDDKREFLADISSFANAGGGDLLYGVIENEGVPENALGLEGNLNAEILRLDNIIRDCLDPRIHGLQMRPIKGFKNGPVLLIRVVKSWIAPHMITFRNLSRFFSRNSAGKYQLDVSEIQTAFLLSDSLPEKMRRFRDDRLGRIIANETPIHLLDGAKLVLHILPIASFATDINFEVSVLKEHAIRRLEPIGCSEFSNKFNLDGFFTHSIYNDVAGSHTDAYSLIFRKGQIEAVYANFLGERDGRHEIPSIAYEDDIIAGVLNYFGVLKSLEIPSPLVIFLSMTGVANVQMGVDPVQNLYGGTPIDRDTLVLPDILIEDYESILDQQAVAKVLRPIFDAVWNACGFECSNNYDEDGNWSK